MSREQFEAWISAPPYEHMCDRSSDQSAWTGQYKRYETQLAWEAWQGSAKREREACAKVCDRQAALQTACCAEDDVINQALRFAADIRNR